jgi:hypothetical protein
MRATLAPLSAKVRDRERERERAVDIVFTVTSLVTVSHGVSVLKN